MYSEPCSVTIHLCYTKKNKPERQLSPPPPQKKKKKKMVSEDTSMGTGAAATHYTADHKLEVCLHQKIRVEMPKEVGFWQHQNVQSISIQAV